MIILFLLVGGWYDFLSSLQTYIFLYVWGSVCQSDAKILKIKFKDKNLPIVHKYNKRDHLYCPCTHIYMTVGSKVFLIITV